MEKKRCRCPKCKTVFDVTNPDGKDVLRISCPGCGVNLKVNFQPHKVEDENKTVFRNKSKRQCAIVLKGERYMLPQGKNTIGRRAQSSQATLQLPVNDKYLSRSHVEIEVTTTASGTVIAMLKNHKNKNATSVNGVILGESDVANLKHGDTITMGMTTVIFENE